MSESEYEHLLTKCRDAKHADHYGVISTGERVAAAVVLNRADWLKEMDYTLAEAFDRIGPELVAAPVAHSARSTPKIAEFRQLT